MSNIVTFRPRSTDYVEIERLAVRRQDGSLIQRYFVSSVIDGGRCFGDFDTDNYAEARAVAAEYGLPILDKAAVMSAEGGQ